jgi:transposase-like protein
MAEFTAQGTERHKTIAKSIGASDGGLHAWIQQYQFHRERAFIKRYTLYSVTINS